jgi:hypothetical protein
MITLRCAGGIRYRDGKECDYSVRHRDDYMAEIIKVRKVSGGFTCPVCRRHPLRAFKSK